MSCLNILSKLPDLCLFWGSVQMHSGRLAVNIDFQPLDPKSDCKGGEDSGDKKFKILIFTFSQHKQFISTDHINAKK